MTFSEMPAGLVLAIPVRPSKKHAPSRLRDPFQISRRFLSSPTTLRLHPFETVGNYGSKQRIALSSKMKLETSEYFSLERCHISLREDSPEPFHCTLSPMSPSMHRGQMCAHRRYCAAVVKDISRKIPTSRVCQSDKSDSPFAKITLS